LHAVAAGVSKLDSAMKQAAETEGYSANLLIYAAVYLVATLAWLGVNAEQKLEPSLSKA
jgi:hypothetical protein